MANYVEIDSVTGKGSCKSSSEGLNRSGRLVDEDSLLILTTTITT